MAGKSHQRLTPEEAHERAELLKDVMHGQTLNRRERRVIEGKSLADLREFARDMDAAMTMQAKGAEEPEIAAAVLDRMNAAASAKRQAR